MEHILSVLMEVSIYSAVIAVTVLVVRKCFAKRMNPVFMIALWAVVLVRFCLPVTLESPVHFDAFFQSKAVESVNDTPAPEVYEGAYTAQVPNIADYEISTPAAMPSVPQSNTAVLPNEAVPEAKQISPYALIIGVWFNRAFPLSHSPSNTNREYYLLSEKDILTSLLYFSKRDILSLKIQREE